MASRSVACKIFIANIPWTIGSRELIRHCSKYGKVFKGEVKFNWETGVPRGYGFVIFDDEDSAAKALSDQDQVLEGGKLYVRQALH